MVLALQGITTSASSARKGYSFPGGALPHPGAGSGPLRPVGDRESRFRPDGGDRHHAHREQIDALETMGSTRSGSSWRPASSGSCCPFPADGDLRRGRDLRGVPGRREAPGRERGAYLGRWKPAWYWVTSPRDLEIPRFRPSHRVGLHVQGYFTRRGAEGVSQATTSAVVVSSVLVLVCDYFLTSVLQ